jgi:hypothetical protein
MYRIARRSGAVYLSAEPNLRGTAERAIKCVLMVFAIA